MSNEQNEEDSRPIEVMWSVQRLGSYLGVSPFTIYRWIKIGKIQDSRKIGATVRIPQSEVQRLMNETKGNIIKKASQ